MMTNKKYDVLVVGELNVDLILSDIESFPEMGKEKIANGMSLVLGSSSAILASNLSALGAKVGFVGKIGNDSFGSLILESLNSKNVDTSNIIVTDDFKTGATVVMSYDNDRANVTYPGAMNELRIEDISEDLLGQARHLHFSSLFLQPGIKADVVQLFQKAKSLGLTTSLDPQWDPAEEWDIDLSSLMSVTDYFLPNISELTALTGTESLDEAIASVKELGTMVVKMGTRGAILVNDSNQTEHKAFLNENVVDTVGAGDSFNAGFLFKFLQGASLEDCMTFASLTGAVSTTAAGGTGAFDDYNSVMKIMENKFGYTEESHEVTR